MYDEPLLLLQGAYDPSSLVYSLEDIADIVEQARLRGIRVIPEFDMPGMPVLGLHGQRQYNSNTVTAFMCYVKTFTGSGDLYSVDVKLDELITCLGLPNDATWCLKNVSHLCNFYVFWM